MLEWALESAPDKPRIESVVAVLDQHRALSEPQKGAPRVAELGSANEHRAVDVVTPVGVRVDRRLAIDESVEERKRAVKPESLGADLQDEERSVTCGLDVQRDELRFVQSRVGTDLRRVDRDLFPRHRLHRSTRFEEDGFWCHLLWANARRAHAISLVVTPRSNRTAPA